MKHLFLINDSLTNKISYYHIMVLLTVLPFDQFYGHAVFGSFMLHTLIHLNKGKLRQLLNWRVLLLQAVFFITLVSCSYTSYASLAITDVTRQLIILLCPIMFSLTSLNIKKYRDNLLLIFSLVCMVTLGYLYVHALLIIRYFHLPVKVLFSNALISHNFSAPIGMHATFLSLQIAVALFYILSRLVTDTRYRLLYLLAALLLFAGIIQLGSKAILVAILITINLAIPYFLITGQKRLGYILLTATLSAVVIFGVLRSHSFRERYITDLKNDLSATIPDETVEPRVVRWKAALEVAQTSPLIGYGAGAEMPVLMNKYFSSKLYSAYINKLNAHNQYLTFLLTTGLVGLLVYLATIYWGFNTAFRKNDLLLFAFLLLVAMVSLSESMLNAEKGIWFYALFFSFFYFSGWADTDKTIAGT